MPLLRRLLLSSIPSHVCILRSSVLWVCDRFQLVLSIRFSRRNLSLIFEGHALEAVERKTKGELWAVFAKPNGKMIRIVITAFSRRR